MASEIKVNKDISYLDLQGLAGVSKHTGGFPATEELLSMCHIEDAKEALRLILAKSGLSQKEGYTRLRDFLVSSSQKYETSAVDYKLLFLLEFLFEENTPIETRVSTIKDLQDFFNKI